MSLPSVRIGLFGIGLDTYWPQFAGLFERLNSYVERVAERLARPNVEIVNLGLVDSADRARDAGHEFRRRDVDIIFLYVTTYALSSTVLPVVRRAGVPIIVLNLVPERSIDFDRFNQLRDRTKMTGEWLAYCSPCPLPEIANVFIRNKIPFHQVSGTLEDDASCWNEINDWIEAARVASALENSRIGLMGHYYNGMLDIYSDVTLQIATFGVDIEILEVDELSALRLTAASSEVQQRLDALRNEFDVQPDCSESDLLAAARTSIALDQLVQRYRLGALAYYYKGSGLPENETTMSSIILGTSRLTGQGIPVAGEYEVKNVLAMKILDLFGIGGSFTEFYLMDYKEDVLLMGHDGPGHPQIAESRTKVRPLEVYHGKVGRGLSVEMRVKQGPVTLLSVVERNDRLALLCAEAESVYGPILEIGNTNSRYRFKSGARHFVSRWSAEGPAHHCAIGVGHLAGRLERFGQLLGLEVIRVD
jgi:L-arabinose isomerase